MDTTFGIQLFDVELVSHVLRNTSNTETNNQATEAGKLENMGGSKNPESTNSFENDENGRNGTETDDSSFVAVDDSQVNTAQEVQSTKQSTPAKQNTSFGFLEDFCWPGRRQDGLDSPSILTSGIPFLAEQIFKFDEPSSRFIKLQDEDVDAFGCFLQFLYMRDYSSKPAKDQVDNNGEQLLKHARVHTLAGKLGIPELKTLSHNKIHSVRSTPRGELEYARYVYAHTTSDDTTLRKPIASYWSTKSQELRHRIEEEFRSLCLDAPEFFYDVLILVP